MDWQTIRRLPRDRARRAFHARAWSIPLRHRTDVVLILGIGLGLAILAALWFVAVQAAQVYDLLDPPLVQPLADERILTNVRDDLTRRPLLDAVYHSADGRVYMAQAGGMIHRYDPATRLWSEETPFPADAPIHRDFVVLRSGCGESPLADNAVACPDGDALWAVSQAGGLARRSDGDWRIVVGDTLFRGASGAPVDEIQLTTAAVSPDKRWLVLGTQDDGIGIYDTVQGVWRTFPADFWQTLPDLRITHLVHWRNWFWIGTPGGLIALRVDRNDQQLIEVTAGAGEVLDLDADEALWVLRRQPCTVGDGCLWMGMYSAPDATPTALFDERHRYPDLQLGDLSFAQQWGEDLTVAGMAGIFTYNIVRHDWQQIEKKQIRVTLPLADDAGFYFGYDGGVGLLQRAHPDQIQFWELPGQRIAQLLTAGPETLALTTQGNVYVLDPVGEAAPLYEVTRTAFEPERFTAAVAVDDTVLFTGPDGLLIHDVIHRRYEDVAGNALPSWLLDEDTQLLSAGGIIYAVTAPDRRSLTIYRLTGSRLHIGADLVDEVNGVTPVDLPGPLTSLWPWGNNGIGVLAGDGSVYQVTPTAVDRLTGVAETELDRLPLLDVIMHDGDLLISTRQGLRRYDLQQRGWDDFFDPPADVRAEELAVFNGELLMRSEAGRLLRPGRDPVLIGDERGFDMADAQVSDAVQAGNRIYLAGNGQVDAYDLAQRQVAQRWDPASGGALTIEALIGDVPLALGNGIAYLGDSAIDREAGRVLSLSEGGGRIWTVRQGQGNRYLKSYNAASPSTSTARCFFRTPLAPGVTTILDARLLPNGLIAAATDVGLFFYRPDARTWYAGPPDLLSQGGRVYRTEDHLILVSAAETRLSIAPLNSIAVPNSCSTSSLALNVITYSVAAVSVDESTNRVAWLGDDGSVTLWTAGQQQEILAATGGGPDPANLRRLFPRNGYWLFTTGNGLWRYDLQKRSWQPIEMANAPATIAEINVETDGNAQIVTVQGQNGSFHVGRFSLAENRVALQPVGPTASPSVERTGSPLYLLDVQARGDDLWTFVYQDRIHAFDPVTRRWQEPGILGDPDPTTIYQRALGRGVAVANGGRTWWIAQATGAAPQSFARYDLDPQAIQTAMDGDGQVWSLDGNWRLQRCAAGEERLYGCQPHSPDAFTLAPEQVRRALIWQDLHLFETDNGLRLYDPAAHSAVPLPAEAIINNVQTVRQLAGRLWLWDGGTLVILQKSAGRVTAQRVEGVRRFVVDSEDTPWILDTTGWQHWQAGSFAVPAVQGDVTAAELAFFVAEGSIPTALDRQGIGYTWTRNRFQPDDLPLPADVLNTSIQNLWRAPNGNWWVQTGTDRLTYVIRTTCAPPPAPTAAIPVTETLPLTGTEAITATLSPQPTPMPVPVPCLVVREQFDSLPLPELAQMARVQVENAELHLFHLNGTRVRVNLTLPLDAGGLTTTTGQPVQVTGWRADEWSALRAHLRPLANGRWAYDPITALTVQNTGMLVAERPLSTEQLASRGALQFEQPAALDAGWLSWGRNRNAFAVATTSGTQLYTPPQFIQDGVLIVEPVAAVLAERLDRLHVANQHGVWTYSRLDLRLTDDSIRFQPISLDLPINAVHGRFLAENGDLPVGSSRVEAARQTLVTTLGDVTLTETVREGGVTGRYPLGSATPSVFGADSFRWDEGRRGLAFGGSELYLQSDAGIHRVDSYADFDPGPTGVDLAMVTLFSEVGGALHLAADGTLYRQTGGTLFGQSQGWQANVPHPAYDRTLVDTSAWTWRLAQNRFVVDIGGQPHDFAHRARSGNYGFTSDWLQAAAWSNSELYILNDAFVEIGKEIGVATLSAARYAPQPADWLDPITERGSETLYRSNGGAITRWDGAQRQFVTLTTDPYQQRQLVTEDRLRLSLDGGRVVKEVRLDDVSGNSHWVTFAFVDGQFPFDVVTGVAADGRGVYVGTAAGLLIYPDLRSLHLNAASQLYDVHSAAGDPVPVVRVGVPVDDRDLLMAISTETCIERRGNSAFTPCTKPDLLDRRLRVDTPLWQWTLDSAGQVTGLYRDAAGQLTDLAATIDEGRFPHDRLLQGMVCGNETVTLWEAGWQSLHAGRGFTLDGSVRNFDLRSLAPQQLVCVPQPQIRSSVTLDSGLYLQGDPNTVYRWTGNGWPPLQNQFAAAVLRQFAANPPLYSRARLLLDVPTEAAPFTFRQRTLNDEWMALPWEEGQLAIDRWSALAWSDNRLWAATPAGLLPFGVPSGQAALDPDALLIVREPQSEGAPCPVSDLQSEGEEVLLRCGATSDQVYRGQLRVSDNSGHFVALDADPFADHDLIHGEETGYWHWRRVERINGEPGRLIAMLREEPLSLAGGRFPFDTPNSVALHSEDRSEVATDAGGWYVAPRQTYRVDALQRPTVQGIAADAVAAVERTRSGDNFWLCLQMTDGSYTRLSAAGDVEQTPGCPAYRGQDPLWQYAWDGDRLSMSALRSVGGVGARRLEAGQFGDNVVLGPPATGRDEEGIFYLLPTRAGVLRLDHTLAATSIHVPPFNGLPIDAAPSAVLMLLDHQMPIYAGNEQLHHLDETRNGVAAQPKWEASQPPTAAHHGPLGQTMLAWHSHTGYRWAVLSPEGVSSDALSLDVSRLDAFYAGRAAGYGLGNWLWIGVGKEQLQLWEPILNQGYHHAPLPASPLMAVVPLRDRLLLIYQQELIDVSLDEAVERLYE
ncbi:MAG: hypothetical protein KF893_09990 [Caldilineaceae bacterium]|nr:hypothetical protein [Caldilineaceae bacterium]